MNELDFISSEPKPSRPARKAARVIADTALAARVRTAASNALTDVTITKLQDATLATGAAMTNVGRVALGQRAVEQLAPETAGRLAFLADDHLATQAELLDEYRRNLRRV